MISAMKHVGYMASSSIWPSLTEKNGVKLEREDEAWRKEAGLSDQYFLVNVRYPLMFIRLWQDVGARVSHTASLWRVSFFEQNLEFVNSRRP
jgi:hypothetical protein